MRPRPVALLAALAALIVPASAHAATVSVTAADGRLGTDAVGFEAAPGETNHVTLAATAANVVTITDTGAPLTAGTGCTAVDPNTATCSGPDGAIDVGYASLGDRDDSFAATIAAGLTWGYLSVLGQDGDDHIDISGAHLNLGHDLSYPGLLDGGAGRDTLIGSPNPDALAGGPGRDTLHGGAGDDLLDGDGQGDDEEHLDTPAKDVIDGGPGRDTVSYAAHSHGVRVDLLHPGSAGAPGEHDALSSIESVIGTRGHDVLYGSNGANELTGFAYEGAFAMHATAGDTIYGRGGNDFLEGGERRDVFSGGSGRDRISYGGGRDLANCGSGLDTIEPWETPVFFPPARCERLDDGSYTFRGFHVSHGALRAKLRRDVTDAICGESIRLTRHGVPLGHVSFAEHVPHGLVIHLNAAGRAAARHRRLARASELGCTGSPHAWVLRL